MRDHELELIAALVEGRLEDETEARALIASSPELMAEYEAQRAAYDAMREAGTAALSESERSALRRDVWTELRSGARVAPSTTPWYYRWAPAAAGVLLVVGLVAVLAQGGGGDSGEQVVAADEAAEPTTSTAAASQFAESGDDDSAPSDGAEESATTSQGKADSGADTAASEAITVYQQEAERLRQGVFGERLRAYDSERSTVEACVEQSGLDDHQILATLSAPSEATDTSGDEGRLAVALPQGAELATAPLFFVDLDTCEVVYTDD